MQDSQITWGVDGFGCRHFICRTCGSRLGYSKKIHDFMIKHSCGDNIENTGPIKKSQIKTEKELLNEYKNSKA